MVDAPSAGRRRGVSRIHGLIRFESSLVFSAIHLRDFQDGSLDGKRSITDARDHYKAASSTLSCTCLLRFFNRVLYELGLVDVREPFENPPHPRHGHQGRGQGWQNPRGMSSTPTISSKVRCRHGTVFLPFLPPRRSGTSTGATRAWKEYRFLQGSGDLLTTARIPWRRDGGRTVSRERPR